MLVFEEYWAQPIPKILRHQMNFLDKLQLISVKKAAASFLPLYDVKLTSV